MSEKGLSTLIERLRTEKSVDVFDFNIPQFVIAAHEAGLNIHGGAILLDEYGAKYGQCFYIER